MYKHSKKTVLKWWLFYLLITLWVKCLKKAQQGWLGSVPQYLRHQLGRWRSEVFRFTLPFSPGLVQLKWRTQHELTPSVPAVGRFAWFIMWLLSLCGLSALRSITWDSFLGVWFSRNQNSGLLLKIRPESHTASFLLHSNDDNTSQV